MTAVVLLQYFGENSIFCSVFFVFEHTMLICDTLSVTKVSRVVSVLANTGIINLSNVVNIWDLKYTSYYVDETILASHITFLMDL